MTIKAKRKAPVSGRYQAEAKTNKIKKSFTLSKASLDYLRRAQRDRHVRSESEALDQILEAARQQQEMEAIKQATIAYYDSLTDEEMKEDAAWGELGSEALRAIEW